MTDANVDEYRILDVAGHPISPLVLPDPVSPQRPWELIPSETSEFIAAYLNPGPNESVIHSLQIIKIPGGKVVRDVAQLLPAGAEIVIGVEHQWSPDGRYFVFSAALPANKLDLFIYDVRLDKVRQLTHQAANLVPWGWSPDSQTLLAREFATRFITENPAEYLGVWAADLDGHAKRLYSPSGWEDVWAWKSNHIFYVLNDDLGKYTYLRTVDAASGQAIELYPGQFTYIALNTPLDEIILTFSSSGSYKVAGVDPGIYRLAGQGQLEKITAGDYWASAYYKELGMFFGFSTDNQMLGFSYDGTIRLKLTLMGNFPVPSPDGQWIINGNAILTADGNPVASIQYGGTEWLPDSSGFYLKTSNGMQQPGELYVYRKSTGWQPELIDPRINPGGPLFRIVAASP